MIAWFKNRFKEKENPAPRVIDKPEMRFANAISGQIGILAPKEDITPYESAQLVNLIGFLILNGLSINGPRLDTQKFIKDHGLERHFRKADPVV